MVLLGGIFALASCTKHSQSDVKPAATAETSQALLATNPTGQPYTVRQQAWLKFVDKVRRGEQVDPTGQYVADGTMLPGRDRPTRPKFDAATASYPFLLRPDGSLVMRPASELKSIAAGKPLPPSGCDIETECPLPPAVTTRFVSSEGVSGSGIVDLKVTINKPYLPGYSLLALDLNSGAGGDEIFYQFTRDPNSVLQGAEYYKGSGYSTASSITRFATDKGSFWSIPKPQPYFWPIWYPSSAYWYNWQQVDLNAGAGGEYIYSFNSKDAQAFNPDGTPGYFPPYTQIGVLSGNSASIQPPAGWQKYPADLNEGAGGSFIYFCYKY